MMEKDSSVHLVFGGKQNVWIRLIIMMNLAELAIYMSCW